MKRILIVLCSITLIVFGLYIYNYLTSGPKYNSIQKIEELRLDAKHTVKEVKKKAKEDDNKNGKKDEDKAYKSKDIKKD
jgi:hypothetical protein